MIASGVPTTNRRRADAGSGLIGTTAGFVVFLSFCLFAVHLLVRLHAATVVTSAALDGARTVAAADVDRHDPAALAAARTDAEAEVRSLLGGIGDEAHLDWAGSDADTVALTVTVPAPDVLPGGLDASLPFDTVARTVRVRAEQLR